MPRSSSDIPSRSKIARAWISYLNQHGHLPWGNEVMDWGQPECWACGFYVKSWASGSVSAWDKVSGLERCHVVPHAMGGSSEPLNLVLMCTSCHKESPDHTDPQFLFDWMRNRPKRVMGQWTPDQIRDIHELVEAALERMSEQEVAGIVRSSLSDFYAGVGTHFGGISDGTRSAALLHLSKNLLATETQ